MALNLSEKKLIEQSRTLCLATLPLMFDVEAFREQVESAISHHADLQTLIRFDSKDFYRFLKQVFRDEEAYNMRHHFEKFFSISGFLRNLLNEIIKLNQSKYEPMFMLKVIDLITYFVGGISLRRAPTYEQHSFVFDNLIDYKSFEFLSKLYKITEKLVDSDDEMVVMNLWYRLVEGKMQNFEILAKFLVHNLSSLSNKNQEAYGIEYEKQKRFSFSIFNFIKARTA